MRMLVKIAAVVLTTTALTTACSRQEADSPQVDSGPVTSNLLKIQFDGTPSLATYDVASSDAYVSFNAPYVCIDESIRQGVDSIILTAVELQDPDGIEVTDFGVVASESRVQASNGVKRLSTTPQAAYFDPGSAILASCGQAYDRVFFEIHATDSGRRVSPALRYRYESGPDAFVTDWVDVGYGIISPTDD